jgi:hypothetical protein
MALLKPSFVALVLALGAVAQQGAYQQCKPVSSIKRPYLLNIHLFP